ncbi:MAG: cyclic nucleotide-binding domain-containing protein [Arenimonas sp.]|jgi:predicted GNAT family N-acyltransferase
MEIEIRPVTGFAELAAISRLRYDVYVRELGRQPAGCDDAQGLHVEDEDEISTIYAAFDGDTAVACLRMTPMDALAPDSRWRTLFQAQDFPVPEAQQAVLSRLVVRADRRATLLAPRLLAAAYDAFRAAGGELIFLRCTANMVPLYEVMGCRRYKAGSADTEAGFRLPMVMIAGDWTYFEAVKSPLLENVQMHAPNVTLGDWFEVQYPEHGRPASVRVLGKDEFLLSFAMRLNDPSIPLLDDLDGDEKEYLFLKAGHRDMKSGEVVLRKGDTGTAMYLILDGAVEVTDTTRGQRRVLTTLGAGQLFGEAGFLMHTPRTADVTAITDSQLVVLDVDGFARLSEEHPAAALKVLRNLCRALCLRLYAHNAG